ncbi:DUF805 domain-containing protein [Schumannella sp. 10F1B-5-1]|uniref:DUF805 domain-containing protein n=1 Tax=Schumannella sp. 10F1B-5-1 TaxID=2590780 RepID=UPI00113118FA|nr:DUF805 domain-containing protein [Schumannella sp. 10F1B-5-1]TPW73148.1 DUF805 domain-containing protein [Schumannella sp. 10F1B-5-1]
MTFEAPDPDLGPIEDPHDDRGRPRLDRPLPGAGPVEAVSRLYRNYAGFSGRASRGEFWWVAFFAVAVTIVIGGVGVIVGVATGTPSPSGDGIQPGGAMFVFLIALSVWYLGSVIPFIALWVRRLHDADYSGWLYLLHAIPYVGPLIALVFAAMPSRPNGARFDR